MTRLPPITANVGAIMASKHYYAAEMGMSLLRRLPKARVVVRFDSKEARDNWVKDDPPTRKRLLASSGEVYAAQKMIRIGFTWPIHFW